MGLLLTTPASIEAEIETWNHPHKLLCDVPLREAQLQALENFEHELQLCSIDSDFDGLSSYRHFFLTDGKWFLEFGHQAYGNCSMMVHNDATGYISISENGEKNNLYIVHDTFRMDHKVKERMTHICGVSNFSLLLRNSEHVARYIHSGCWVSFQLTSNESKIMRTFAKHLKNDAKKIINTIPGNLKEQENSSLKKLYPQIEIFVKYLTSKNILDKAQKEFFNILFLGPTGCGKSHLINILFNQEVSKSAATVHSVTRDVIYFRGVFKPHMVLDKESKFGEKVNANIIDTIGLCDSKMKKDDIYQWIKERIKGNVVYIDVVVIILSGRIEKVQQEALRDYMKWLRYQDFTNNFVFIYNKADNLTLSEKTNNIVGMGSILGINPGLCSQYATEGYATSVEYVFTTAFPPNAPYESIKADRKRLYDAVLMERKQRIAVTESSCNIL